MITDASLPDWPPPPDEPFGDELAHAWITWMRQHVGPLVAYGRRRLQERYPGKTPRTASVAAEQLATWRFGDEIDALNIGGVYVEVTSGAWAWMDIVIRRDGRLECRPGQRMRS